MTKLISHKSLEYFNELHDTLHECDASTEAEAHEMLEEHAQPHEDLDMYYDPNSGAVYQDYEIEIAACYRKDGRPHQAEFLRLDNRVGGAPEYILYEELPNDAVKFSGRLED